MAPGSGFYTTPGLGKNEVRLAYVLKKEDLANALIVLSKALGNLIPVELYELRAIYSKKNTFQ